MNTHEILATIEQTLVKTDQWHKVRKQKVTKTLEALPVGSDISGWVLTDLAGDFFWMKNGKGLTSWQLWESYPSKVASFLQVDRYNWLEG